MTTTGTGEIEMGAGCYTLGSGSLMTARLHDAGANLTLYDPDQLSGNLEVTSGSFVIKTPWTVASFDTLTIDGGLVDNPGNIVCNDIFRWSGGTLTSTGRTTVAPSCTGIIDPPGTTTVTLDAQTLANDGVLTWSTGGVASGNGATIQNEGTFRANSETAPLEYSASVGGMLPWFDNCGQLSKTAGTGTTTISTLFTTCPGAPAPDPGTGSIVFSGDDVGTGDDNPRSPRIGEPGAPSLEDILEGMKQHIRQGKDPSRLVREFDDFDAEVTEAIEEGRSKEMPRDRTVYQLDSLIVIYNPSQPDGNYGSAFRRPSEQSAIDFFDAQEEVAP